MTEPIRITHASEADAPRIWRLADPFHPTADIVEMLRFQARHEEVAA